MVNLPNFLCRASRSSPRADGARKLSGFPDHPAYWPPATAALYFGTPNPWPSDWRWDWNAPQRPVAQPAQAVPLKEPLLLDLPAGANIADYERVEIPWNPQRPHDGAYEVCWRRRAKSRTTPPPAAPAQPGPPHHHPAPSPPRPAQPVQLGTQGHASPAARAAAAAALATSAALLDDTIPEDAREYLRLGAQLLKEAMGADLPGAQAPPPAVPAAPEPAPAPGPRRSPKQRQSPPLPPPAPARSTVDYDGGVHTFLSQFGRLIFDMASPEYTAAYRDYWTPQRFPVAFGRFLESAVEPRVRKLIVISRQFPWHIDVSVEHEPADRYVLVSDVLRRLREEARTTLSQSEYELMLHIDGGKERLHRAFDRRMDQFPDDRRVLRRVDFLGEHTILAGLRRDRNHEVLSELVDKPWPPGTEDTLHLVANFVTPEHVRAVLGANNFA